MDGFIDKLAQKISGGEMIKANIAAENKELQGLKMKIEGYEDLLSDMRKVNLNNTETAKQLEELKANNSSSAKQLKELSDKTEELKKLITSSADNTSEKEYADQIFDKTTEVIHTENVKVYRNVQAALKSELEEQTKTILDSTNKPVKNNNKFLGVMSVLIFIAVLADIALRVLEIMGIL